jgi:hypothetical protein
MRDSFAKGLLIFGLGALCLWSNPAQSRFGGHFGGGGFRGGGFGHFGGGMRFGGPHFGGMRFGGSRFGGMRFGGHRYGGIRFAHRSFPHWGAGHLHRHVFAGHHHLGAVGRQTATANRFRAPQRFAGRSNALAHAAIAGAGLHQVHAFSNFNHHPFNRNAFGNRVAWNRFALRFNRHCCGWFGPVFWPFFIGDVLTAVLWPWDGYDPFWVYGTDYIRGGIFWGGYDGGVNYAASDIYDIYGNQARRRSYVSPDPNAEGDRFETASGQAARSAFSEACNGLAPGVTSLPLNRIQREVQPMGDQLAAFEDLRSALARADEMIGKSCSNEVPLTPVKRLEAVKARLNAMAGVVRTLKGPLSNFYNSLSVAQRQRLDAVRGEVGADRPRARTASGNGLATLCSGRAAAFSQVPVQRIEDDIRPTAQQRSAFDALKTASVEASERLRSSCPAEAPPGMVDRLQAVDARLAAMLSAIDVVRPALEEFYGSLTDEQKARFNSWGEPQRQAGANSH